MTRPEFFFCCVPGVLCLTLASLPAPASAKSGHNLAPPSSPSIPAPSINSLLLRLAEKTGKDVVWLGPTPPTGSKAMTWLNQQTRANGVTPPFNGFVDTGEYQIVDAGDTIVVLPVAYLAKQGIRDTTPISQIDASCLNLCSRIPSSAIAQMGDLPRFDTSVALREIDGANTPDFQALWSRFLNSYHLEAADKTARLHLSLETDSHFRCGNVDSTFGYRQLEQIRASSASGAQAVQAKRRARFLMFSGQVQDVFLSEATKLDKPVRVLEYRQITKGINPALSLHNLLVQVFSLRKQDIPDHTDGQVNIGPWLYRAQFQALVRRFSAVKGWQTLPFENRVQDRQFVRVTALTPAEQQLVMERFQISAKVNPQWQKAGCDAKTFLAEGKVFFTRDFTLTILWERIPASGKTQPAQNSFTSYFAVPPDEKMK